MLENVGEGNDVFFIADNGVFKIGLLAFSAGQAHASVPYGRASAEYLTTHAFNVYHGDAGGKNHDVVYLAVKRIFAAFSGEKGI